MSLGKNILKISTKVPEPYWYFFSWFSMILHQKFRLRKEYQQLF